MTRLISLIIPMYNAAKTISLTIETSLAQEEVGEVIIVDDCSSDDGASMVKIWQQRDARIKYFKTEKNSGSGKARNIGILNATLPYLSFIDADDFFSKDRFKKAIQILKANPYIDGVYSTIKNIKKEEFRPASWNHEDVIGVPYKIKPEDLFYYIINEKGDFFGIQSIVIHTNSINKCGYFDENLLIGQDIDFIYSLTQNCSLVDTEENEIKIFRTLHDSNITSSSKYLSYNPRFRIVKKWVNKCKNEKLNLKTKKAFYIRYVHHIYKNEKFTYPKPIKWLKKTQILLGLLLKKSV
jgi:glycosyltransferase involved in cell wall biosynthesis